LTDFQEAAMDSRDPRVDAYIEKAAPFAQPILRHLRDTIHAASPEIEEAMKWSFPHFMHHGILCSMAAFKEHCSFGFWKESLVLGSADMPRDEAMGQFGRIQSISDLPPRDTLIAYVRKAMTLNEEGVGVPGKAAGKERAELEVPELFRLALERHPEAAAAFEGFSPSHRREYVEWIAEAKREETRDRRIQTALQWLAEGKPRNWKYMKR
jgi:uncharacterized protein YdeI (YjbR/CyaY-like superfamily)